MTVLPEDADKGVGERRSDIYEAHIVGTIEQLDALLRSVDLDVGCSHPHFQQNDDRTVSLLVYSDLAQVEQLRTRGNRVELGENVSLRAEALKGEFSTGDRFDGGRVAPRGFGVKIPAGGRK